MKFLAHAILVLFLGMGAWALAGQPAPVLPSPVATAQTRPAEAKTTDEIVKATEPVKGFGQIQSVEFNRWGRRVFALWYCPFSGRGDCYLAVYYYDYDKTQWTRFLDQLVPSGGDLSAEMPSGEEIVVRSSDGKVAVKESVAKYPQKKT